VKTQFANLREAPDSNSKVTGLLKKGMKLTLLEEKKEWYRVRLEDGKEGWVAASVTSLQPE
jgi:N-acetylmuramoyl-L-alanine amidase